MELTGGCLCGAVRFRVTGEPLEALYCHCTLCQKSTGGPFSTSATVPMEAFAITNGEPRVYESSPGFVRLFCGDCGSFLGFQAKSNPRLANFELGCLDDPNAIKPKLHMYTSTQVEWCHIADELPRHDEVAPEVEEHWAEWENWTQPD